MLALSLQPAGANCKEGRDGTWDGKIGIHPFKRGGPKEEESPGEMREAFEAPEGDPTSRKDNPGGAEMPSSFTRCPFLEPSTSPVWDR